MSVILATQEAEIWRKSVQSQAGQIVLRPYLEKTLHKQRAGGMAQGGSPEFKPKYLSTFLIFRKLIFLILSFFICKMEPRES
jgi:hypothetical protein